MKAVETIVAGIERLRSSRKRPVVVGLDGASGSGKSTIADIIQTRIELTLVRLDDFYNTNVPEQDWPNRSVGERLAGVFDWERVRRDALGPLREGKPGRWHAFDYAAGIGSNGCYGLQSAVTEVAPAPVILIDGAYCASEPLVDWLDFRVLVQVPVQERHRRLALRQRADFLVRWHAIWDDVEAHYFDGRSVSRFELVVDNERC